MATPRVPVRARLLLLLSGMAALATVLMLLIQDRTLGADLEQAAAARLDKAANAAGLLAASHEVPVIVGYAARVGRGFRYRIEVERIIRPEEWRNRDDPVFWITQEYSRALESAIRKHPEQYLWMHRRWKSRPRDEE